jgi:hypothetical protein
MQRVDHRGLILSAGLWICNEDFTMAARLLCSVVPDADACGPPCRRRQLETVLLTLMLTAALACGGATSSPTIPSSTALPTATPERQSDCPSFPCALTGTVNASSEVDHFVKLVRNGQLTIGLMSPNGTSGVVGMYLRFCAPRGMCSTSYEGVGNSYTLFMAANKLQVGDGVLVTISNSGPSTPYRLEIDWEGSVNP